MVSACMYVKCSFELKCNKYVTNMQLVFIGLQVTVRSRQCLMSKVNSKYICTYIHIITDNKIMEKFKQTEVHTYVYMYHVCIIYFDIYIYTNYL